MPPRTALLFTTLLCAWNFSSAQGGSTIITLVMPPPGADGYQALQSGGAFATGAASLYYNPASLPMLERETGSSINATFSRQDLLPGLNLPGLNQNFTAVSFTHPDEKHGFDWGVGLFRNSVNFGDNLSSSDSSPPFDAHETVYALGLGLRLGLPISVGGTVKYYDSPLSSGVDSSGQRVDGTARGWAFDIGILAAPRLKPLTYVNIQSVDLTPSAGVTLQNLGPDAWYASPDETDPIPRLVRGSLGIHAGFADLLGFSWGEDWEKGITRRERWDDPAVRTYGTAFSFFWVTFGKGRLRDPSGQRNETHRYLAMDVGALQTYRLVSRLRALDFTSGPEKFEAGYPFAAVSVFGGNYRMNPRLQAGTRWIEEHDDGIRGGQKAWYFSVAL